MAYLGPAPANSIIATSDIEDDAITTAKIVDDAVTSAKLGGNIVTPGTLDINGQEFILDANANTSITADTDDQIDIKIAGADDFRFTANNFNILSGSTLTVDSGATIANSGTATGFGKIVGIKAVTVSTLTSTTGTSYVDVTDVTLDYAQTVAGNYCLITCIGTMQGGSSDGTTQVRPWASLNRDGSVIGVQSFNLIAEASSGGNFLRTFSGCIQAYSSAGDTDSSTYKLQIKGQNASTDLHATWGSGISGNSTTVLSIMEFGV